MAEVVLRGLADEVEFGHLVEVDSAGTGDWHIGERADRRALSALRRHGYDGSAHRARQFDPRWFAARELVIALDRGHLRTLRSLAADEHERRRIQLLRGFDPEIGPEATPYRLDVPDPFYEKLGAFEEVLRQIEAACAGLLDHVRGEVDGRPTPAR